MVKSISAFLIFLFIIEQFQHIHSFKWHPLNAGDSIPENAVPIFYNGPGEAYVGRTKYLNSMQLAKVYNGTYGRITIYSKELIRESELEVLVAKDCKWVSFYKTDMPPQDLVLGGTAWNGEPIYVGRGFSNSYSWELASLYLTSRKIETLLSSNTFNALTCNENHSWVDANSSVIPENSVYVRNIVGYERYVARLLGPSSYLPGTAIPSQKTTVVWDDKKINSFTNQVLVSDFNTYSWKETEATIPDYAVACGISKNNELLYAVLLEVSEEVQSWWFSKEYYYDKFRILVRNE